MRIYLIGYMGAGKTSIGRELADRLNLEFVDIDLFIEKRYKKSINKIFSEYGEDYFRKIEHNILKEISFFENIIVSTGGGTACFYDNIDIMNNNGITIYLSTSPEILSKRLYSCKDRRPLIKDKNKHELITFIKNNLAQRISHYNKAHIIFDTDKISRKEDINFFLSDLIQEIHKKSNI